MFVELYLAGFDAQIWQELGISSAKKFGMKVAVIGLTFWVLRLNLVGIFLATTPMKESSEICQEKPPKESDQTPKPEKGDPKTRTVQPQNPKSLTKTS
jgi:hypothetical protein